MDSVQNFDDPLEAGCISLRDSVFSWTLEPSAVIFVLKDFGEIFFQAGGCEGVRETTRSGRLPPLFRRNGKSIGAVPPIQEADNCCRKAQMGLSVPLTENPPGGGSSRGLVPMPRDLPGGGYA